MTPLADDEPHPATPFAMTWLKEYIANNPTSAHVLLERLSEMSGNRMAVICGETLRQVLAKGPVTDRCLLGLCWFLQGLSAQGWDGPEVKLPRMV